MDTIKRFVIMLQFMTAIPVRINISFDSKDLGRGLALVPLIGLILGGILAILYKGLVQVFPPLITAVFLVIAYLVLSGGIHFDGLGDTFDGVFSNRSKERVLEIMHDSRIGTNAALVIICVIMLYIAFLTNIAPGLMIKTLVLMPVAGRTGCLIAAGTSQYARKDESLGKPFVDYCGIREVITGLLIYFAIFLAFLDVTYVIISIIPVLFSFILSKYFSSKIGGVTGDILGAVCELNQVLFLMTVYLCAGNFL